MSSVMQFRDFVFRNNPHTITISDAANLAVHFCPGRGEIVQNMGPHARRVECKGCFFGDTMREAMAQLVQFRQKTQDAQAGMLFVPGLEPFLAQLRELVFEEQGDGRIIGYNMVFVEAKVQA